MSGFPSISKHPLCVAVLNSGKRNYSKKNRKEPLTTLHLSQMAKILTENHSLSNLRLLAIVLLTFAGFFRISETLSIRASHVTYSEDHIQILLPSSKTDVFRDGNTVLIAQTGNITCPCTALLRYLDAAKIPIISDDYIFRGIIKKGNSESLTSRKLSYTRARENLLSTIKLIGLNPKLYGTHSLRSGGATKASETGVSPDLLKSHGRWRSENAKMRYIKSSTSRRLSVSKSLQL